MEENEPKGGLLDQSGMEIKNLPERGFLRKLADWASSKSMRRWGCLVAEAFVARKGRTSPVV